MAEDILQVITSFSATYYGRRAAKNKQTRHKNRLLRQEEPPTKEKKDRKREDRERKDREQQQRQRRQEQEGSTKEKKDNGWKDRTTRNQETQKTITANDNNKATDNLLEEYPIFNDNDDEEEEIFW